MTEKSAKESNCKNFNKVCEKFVLDNSERKKMSANEWLQTYESKCDRMSIKNEIQRELKF